MENAQDYMSAMLGGATERPTRVTANTIGKVRAAQAEQKFNAEREELQAAAREQEAVVAELAEECVAHEGALAQANERIAQLQEQLATAQQQLAAAQAQAAAAQQAAAQSAQEATMVQQQAQLDAKQAELATQQQALADKDQALAKLQAEMDELHQQLAEAEATALSSSVLLDKPDAAEEVFYGELRYHVLDALREALTLAEQDGRERRAQLLEAVLAANPQDGEMANFRTAAHRLLVDGDGPDWKAFEALGFKHTCVNGKHTLTWAGVTMPLDCAPSTALAKVLC